MKNIRIVISWILILFSFGCLAQNSNNGKIESTIKTINNVSDWLSAERSSIVNKVPKIITSTNNTKKVLEENSNKKDIRSISNIDKLNSESYTGKNIYKKQERIELIEKRDAKSKTFLNTDGSYTKVQTNGYFHYKDKMGQWIPFDGKLSQNKSTPNIYEISSTDLPISIDFNSGKTSMTLENNQKIIFGENIEFLVLNNKLNEVSRTPSSKGKTVNLNEKKIQEKNIWSGIDKQQKFDFWYSKTEYIINNRPNTNIQNGYFAFEDKIELPSDWQIVKSNDGVETDAGWQGDLLIINSAGKEIGRFQLPVYYENSPNNSSENTSCNLAKKSSNIESNDNKVSRVSFISGTYRFYKKGDKYVLSVMVPLDWLLATDRMFPVTIDPTTSNTYASGNISSCYYPAFYSANMNVTIPNGSTVTSTNSQCTYIAVSPSWRSDGWIGFQSGSNLDGYWYCNVNSPGTCNITGTSNSTIANGTYSSGIVPFTLKVSRDYPSGSCNTNYLYVQNATWTETVTYTTPCTIPGSPDLTSPANNAYAQPGKTIHYSWNAPATGTPPFSYTFYLYDGSSWQSWSTGTDTFIDLQLSEYNSASWCGTNIQWYVKATNSCGNTNSVTRNLYSYPKYSGSMADYTITPTSSCQSTGAHSMDQGGANYYEFYATAGSTYYFSTCAIDLGCGTNTGWDTYLKVYGTDGSCTTSAYNDDGGSCSNYESYINGWTCSTTGTYYLQITGYNSSAYGTYYLQYKSCTSPGSLTLSSPAANANVQPGKTIHFTWNEPASGSGPFTYTFYLWNGASWLNWDCDTNKYIDLQLSEYNSASWCGANIQWYVKATNSCGNTNSVTRNLYSYPKYSGSMADYTITPTSSCQSTGAHSMDQGGANYYEFYATAGSTYYFSTCAIDLGCGTNTGWDTYLKVYGTDGSCTTSASNDDGGSCSNYESYINGWTCSTTGTYYLQITGYNSSAYGNYYLQYKRTCPTLTANLSGGSSPVCYNTAPATFTATGSGGDGIYNYLWYLNGSPTGVTTQIYDVPALTDNASIYCAVSSCEQTVNTSVYNVTVYSDFRVDINGGTSPICSGTSPGTFNADATGGTGIYSYLWFKDGISTGVTTQTYNPGNLTASSEFYCEVSNGICGTIHSSSIFITVNPSPVADAGPDKIISLGQSTMIGSTAIPGNSYTWTPTTGLNDPQISNPVASPNITTSYILSVQNSIGCFGFDTVNVEISNNVSIDSNYAWCGYSPNYAIYYNLQSTRDSIDSIHISKRITLPCSPHFNLTYDDDVLGIGFFDPVLGQQRRDCACAVFQYLESVFDMTTLGGDVVNIIFWESGPINGNPNALAAAAPFWNPDFNAGNPGIYEGNVFEYITTGNDPDPNNDFDGHIQVNFNFDFADCNSPVGTCQFDLYSVILHEVGHAFGLLSLVREDINLMPTTATGLNQFTLYDWQFLFRGDINTPPLDKLINGTINNPTINGAFGVSSLRNGMIWTHNTGRFLNNQPVYSGAFSTTPSYGFLINAGSLVSHLDGHYLVSNYRGWLSPGYLPHYLMSPIMERGEERREITIPEIRLMLEMGYNLSNTFINNTNYNGVDLDGDIVNINRPPYTTKQTTNPNVPTINDLHYPDIVQSFDIQIINDGMPQEFDLALDPTIIDPDLDAVRVEDNTLFNIRGCGDGNNHNQLVLGTGISGVPNSMITFTPRPDFIGRAQFGFYLHDGQERGSFMIYTIDVLPGPAFVNTNNPNTPVGAAELVVNGDCEQGSEVKTTPFNQLGPYSSLDLGKGCREGEYYVGVTYADAHPLLYTNYAWTSSHGNIIIRNSFKPCNTSLYPASFGSRPFDFQAPPVAPWFNPDHNNAGDRYQYLMQEFNYFTLAEDITSCTVNNGNFPYILRFDINLDNVGLPVGSIYNLIIGFTSQATHPNINYNFSLPPQAIVVAGGWQTIEIPFYYCSANPSSFLNFEGNNQRAYIDNVSLTLGVPIALEVNAGQDEEICFGSNVTLNPTVNVQKCDYQYNWSPAAGLSCTNCQNPVASPAATTTYSVTVTDIFGCEEAIDDVIITVNPLPIANAGADVAICNGSSTQLTATGGVIYEWSPVTGLDDPNIANPTATPAVTTTYTVTVTDNNGCTATDEVIVTVNPLPTANAGADVAICEDSSTQLTATGGVIYEWSPVTGLDDPNIANPTATPTVTTTYTVTVTNANGCTATDDVIVTVNPLPTPVITGSLSYCNGQSATLDAGSGYLLYEWSTGATSQIINATIADNPISVTVTDVNNCVGISPVVNVIENPLPTANAGPDVAICEGSSTQLTATGGVIYEWSPVTGLDDPNIANPTATPTITTTYTVTVTDANGCTATDEVIITVNPLPNIYDLTGGGSYCAGSGIYVSLNGSEIGINYQLLLNGTPYGNIIPGTGGPLSGTPNLPTGTYTGIATNPVTGCSVLMNGTFDVIQNPLPVADAGQDQTICGVGNSVQLTATGGTTYEWSPVTGLDDPNIANPIASPTVTTLYTVTVSDANGCTATDDVLVIISTDPNCICSGTPVQSTWDNNLSLASNALYTLNQDVTVIGTNVIISDVAIAIAPGKIITIINGASLTINHCHLYSCTDMWQGIVVNPGGTLILNDANSSGSTMIEDAVLAIDLSSPNTSTQLFIDNTIFNRNLNSVSIYNYMNITGPNTYPNFSFSNSVFTSRDILNCTSFCLWPSVASLQNLINVGTLSEQYDLNGYSTIGLKNPNALVNPNSGIILTSVGALSGNYFEVLIEGDNGNGTINLFDNLLFGINATNSNFTCQNGAFQNIIAETYPNSTNGFGIGAKNIMFASPVLNRIRVIGGNNTFFDCTRSVDVSRYDEIYVNDAIMRSDRNFIYGQPDPSIGVLGVYIRTPHSHVIDVGNNTITNLKYGISFAGEDLLNYQTYSDYQSIVGTVSFHDNTIQSSLPGAAMGFENVSIGIVAASLMNYSGSNIYLPPYPTGANIEITDNHLYDVNSGIVEENWFFYYYYLTPTVYYGVGNRAITSRNYIRMKPDPNPANQIQIGVYHILNWNGIITDNNIQGFDNSFDDWYGIYCADNISLGSIYPEQIVTCNNAYNTGTGIGFYGDQTSTVFENNIMEQSHRGLLLNNAMLGKQGNENNCYASGNKWPVSSYSPGQYKTYTMGGSDPLYSILVIDPSNSNQDPESQGTSYNWSNPYLLNLVLSSTNGSLLPIGCPNTNIANCNYPSNKILQTGNQGSISNYGLQDNQVSWLEQLVNDSVYFAIFAPEQHINALFRVYGILQAQPEFMDSSVILLNFYSSASGSNIGKLVEVEDSLTSGQISQAAILLAGIVPQNEIELNYKNFYTAYIHLKDSTYSAQDSVLLMNLVTGCPVRDGMAVRKARILYSFIYNDFTIYPDNCTDSLQYKTSSFVNNIRQNQAGLSFNVYPNPSNGTFKITLDGSGTSEDIEVSIKDLMGKLVKVINLKLKDNSVIFNEKLSNGVYIISVKDNNGNIYNPKKITIIK